VLTLMDVEKPTDGLIFSAPAGGRVG